MVKKIIKAKKAAWKPEKGSITKYPKGVSGNPSGRPKGSKNKGSMAELNEAIRDVAKKKRKSILRHFVEEAYVDNTVLIALMKKLCPDLRSTEGTMVTFESSMPDEEAAAIRKILLMRWKNNNG